MDTAVRVAVDIGGVLSLASLAAFLGAGVRLLRERSRAARPTPLSSRRAETTHVVFLTF